MEWAGSRKETACQIYRDLVLENIEEDALIPNPRIDQLDEIVDIPFTVPAGQTASRPVARAITNPSPPLLPFPQTTSSLPG